MKKTAGIRFSRNEYYGIEADKEAPTLILTSEVDGEVKEYDVLAGNGQGTFTVDLKSMPKEMNVGDTYQINYNCEDGATANFTASSSAATVNASGLITAVSAVNSVSVRMYFKDSEGTIIGKVLNSIKIV